MGGADRNWSVALDESPALCWDMSIWRRWASCMRCCVCHRRCWSGCICMKDLAMAGGMVQRASTGLDDEEVYKL